MPRQPGKGRPRRDAIVELVQIVPVSGVIVDIGCDHGYVARAVGAIASERAPHRLPAADVGPRVVGDGLQPFRAVAMAIITGIGAHQIARILTNGPPPDQAVLHAPDRPAWLRQWLADNGYRITHERLAPEGRGLAEVTRVERGREERAGHALWFGPGLLHDPLLRAHVTAQLAHWRRIEELTRDAAPQKAQEAQAWARFLVELLVSRGWSSDSA